jgi:hypothetical protein
VHPLNVEPTRVARAILGASFPIELRNTLIPQPLSRDYESEGRPFESVRACQFRQENQHFRRRIAARPSPAIYNSALHVEFCRAPTFCHSKTICRKCSLMFLAVTLVGRTPPRQLACRDLPILIVSAGRTHLCRRKAAQLILYRMSEQNKNNISSTLAATGDWPLQEIIKFLICS